MMMLTSTSELLIGVITVGAVVLIGWLICVLLGRLCDAIAGAFQSPPLVTDGKTHEVDVRPTEQAPKRSDVEAIARIVHFRETYRDGPLGLWRSSLDYRMGLGFDGTGLFGSSIEFRADGSGTQRKWSVMTGDETVEFRWHSVGPCQITIAPANDVVEDDEGTLLVTYDFFMVQGCNEVYLYEVGYSLSGDTFWHSAGPLIRC